MFVRRLAGCVLCASAAFVLAPIARMGGLVAAHRNERRARAASSRRPARHRARRIGRERHQRDRVDVLESGWPRTIEGTELMFTNTQYIADMKVNYAAVATHAGGLGVLGLQRQVLSIGDIVVTTEDAPDGTGEILKPDVHGDRRLLGPAVHRPRAVRRIGAAS